MDDSATARVDTGEADYLISYDPQRLEEYITSLVERTNGDREATETQVLPKLLRYPDNRVHLYDWLTHASLSFGMQPTKTSFSRDLQASVAQQIIDVQSPYEVDSRSGQAITDEDGNPVVNEDYLDPDVLDEAAVDLDKPNLGIDPDRSPRVVRYADSDSLAYYLEDNQGILSDGEQQRILVFASYLTERLNIDLDGETRARRRG